MKLIESLLNKARVHCDGNFHTTVRKTHLVETLQRNRKLKSSVVVSSTPKTRKFVQRISREGIVNIKWNNKRNLLA